MHNLISRFLLIASIFSMGILVSSCTKDFGLSGNDSPPTPEPVATASVTKENPNPLINSGVQPTVTSAEVFVGKSEKLTDQEVVQIFQPDQKQTKLRTMGPMVPERPRHRRKPEYSPNNEIALSIEIMFGYNSADLTDAGKEQLTPVGKALASGKIKSLDYVIEGHTDAIGSDAYNKRLSEERAASVKAFLVNTFTLPSSSIQIVGKGKSNLRDPSNPTNEVNRRVRIIVKK
jgi:outer membrane protein OmpA-like peptidoglycan-associated protein